MPKQSRAPKSDRADLLARRLRDYERTLIADALEKHAGHVGKAAAELGITRRSLERKMAAHGLRAGAAAARREAGIGGPREP